MELIEELLRYVKTNGVMQKSTGKAADWWIGLWGKLVLLFVILILDAECKIHGLNSVVTYATLVVPFFALLILGNPLRQVEFTAIWTMFVHKRKGGTENETAGERAAEGFATYWTIVGIVLLWAFVIPLGIKIIPIQYAPGAFWVFLPAIAAHELAWWRGWHNDKERDFRRYMAKFFGMLVLASLLIPFVYASSAMLYEQYGIALPIHRTSTTVVNQAVHENEQILERKTTECIDKIIANTTKRGVALRDIDYAAMELCKKEYAPVAPPRPQGEAGSNGEYGIMHYFIGMGVGFLLLHIIGTVLIAGGLGFAGYKLVKNKDDDTTVIATKKTEKAKTAASWRPFDFVVIAGIAYLIASWVHGGWITSPADVAKLFETKSAEQSRLNPNAFLTPEEVKHFQAWVRFPAEHPLLGELKTKSFALETADRRGNRPKIVDDIEGGYGKPVLIKFDEDNEGKDVIMENTVCNAPKLHADNEWHTTCIGQWKMRNGGMRGRFELIENPRDRIATLFSVDRTGATVESIVIAFHQ